MNETNSKLSYKLKLYLAALTILVVAMAILTIFNTMNRTAAIDASVVSIRQDSGLVQWKTPGEKWQTLISVDQLTSGTNGRDGAKGDTGANGVNGSRGAIGSPGADGVAGASGANGSNGQDGRDGADGATGAQGSTGIAGAPGTNGADGAQGQAGANGVDGTNGTNGADGTAGIQGAVGANGVNGTDGREIELQKGTLYIQWRYVGSTTWNNIIAYSDLKGDKGDTGETGLTGANGTQGIQGLQGIQGIQGIQGQDGSNGIGNSIEPKEVTTTTVATTGAKIGTTTGGNYVPTKGGMVLLTLTAANTATNPTLNIDGSGAKNILIGNVAPTTVAMAGTKVLMWYDGTAYQLFGSQRATDSSNTYIGITGATITTTTATATLTIDRFTIANYAAGKLMFTLPSTAAAGSVVEVYAASAGGYRITSGASANILYPDGTNSGLAGWIETTQYGTITLRCVVANNTWVVTDNSKLITNNNGVNYN